jgi:hypothetical protein
MIKKIQVPYATYGSFGCSTWSRPCDHTLGLYCTNALTEQCACPNAYGANYCDCPITKYWNGVTCGMF